MDFALKSPQNQNKVKSFFFFAQTALVVLPLIHGLSSAGSVPVAAEDEVGFSIALGPPPPEKCTHTHTQTLLTLSKAVKLTSEP